MVQWMRTLVLLALLITASVGGIGCGSSSKSTKVIVKGQVTIDGNKAEGVTLSFYGPTDKAASGVVTTQADGTYEVMFMSAAGEGNYKVTATKVPAGAVGAPGEGIDDYQMKLAGASRNALPARYNDVSTSGLSAPIQMGMNEGKNFALKSR